MKNKEAVIDFFDYYRVKEAFRIVFFFCTLPICTLGAVLCTVFSTLPMLPGTISVFALLSLILFVCCYFIMYFAEVKYKNK